MDKVKLREFLNQQRAERGEPPRDYEALDRAAVENASPSFRPPMADCGYIREDGEVVLCRADELLLTIHPGREDRERWLRDGLPNEEAGTHDAEGHEGDRHEFRG